MSEPDRQEPAVAPSLGFTQEAAASDEFINALGLAGWWRYPMEVCRRSGSGHAFAGLIAIDSLSRVTNRRSVLLRLVKREAGSGRESR
jgi:hypothetical protein